MTARLGAIAAERWADLDGYAVAHGMPDLRTLPLDRFVNFIWWISTRYADMPATEKFRAQLWRPPVGEAPHPASPWSPEAETAAFSALRAGLGSR